MYSRMFGIHGTISTLLAVAILGFSALVLDRAHMDAAPVGTVEIGELVPHEVLRHG